MRIIRKHKVGPPELYRVGYEEGFAAALAEKTIGNNEQPSKEFNKENCRYIGGMNYMDPDGVHRVDIAIYLLSDGTYAAVEHARYEFYVAEDGQSIEMRQIR